MYTLSQPYELDSRSHMMHTCTVMR